MFVFNVFDYKGPLRTRTRVCVCLCAYVCIYEREMCGELFYEIDFDYLVVARRNSKNDDSRNVRLIYFSVQSTNCLKLNVDL